LIVGIGIDLIELERIRRVLDRHGDRFLDRVLTPAERAYCHRHLDPAPPIGARFAAKEAVLKALGTGLARGMRWQDVEIVRDEQGAPRAELSGEASRLARKRGVDRVLVSLTHDRGNAAAVAVLERDA